MKALMVFTTLVFWSCATFAQSYEYNRNALSYAEQQLFQELLEKAQCSVEVKWKFLVDKPDVHSVTETTNLGLQFEIYNYLGKPISNVRLWVAFAPKGIQVHDATARVFPLPVMPTSNPQQGWRCIRLGRIGSNDKVQVSYQPDHLFKTREVEIYTDIFFDIEGPNGEPSWGNKLQPPIKVYGVTRTD